MSGCRSGAEAGRWGLGRGRPRGRLPNDAGLKAVWERRREIAKARPEWGRRDEAS